MDHLLNNIPVLDDNTYTNKTWAEVSGIDVREVHTMEVEFLSNMRYGLFISESAWKEWHIKLGRFGTFINKAIKSLEASSRYGIMNGSSSFGPKTLPSPPSFQQQSQLNWRYPQNEVSRTSTPVLLPQIASTVVSPIGPLPDLDIRSSARKRSFDDEEDQEPLAKRQLTN